MRSAEAVAVLRERLRDELVVASLGTPSYLLNAAGDRPLNFYLWAAMGMASSVGLGLAIARPDRCVVILDGDGAALMNLGGMVTVGWRAPRNLVWLVLQNGVFLETGGQPIATGASADLAAIARGAGIANADTADDVAELTRLLESALAAGGPTLIVARVEPDGSRDSPPLDPVRIKNRFMDAVAQSERGDSLGALGSGSRGRPLLGAVQDPNDLDGAAAYSVGDEIRRAGNDQLAGPGDPTGAAAAREGHQRVDSL